MQSSFVWYFPVKHCRAENITTKTIVLALSTTTDGAVSLGTLVVKGPSVMTGALASLQGLTLLMENKVKVKLRLLFLRKDVLLRLSMYRVLHGCIMEERRWRCGYAHNLPKTFL